jgi:hypothetical protein
MNVFPAINSYSRDEIGHIVVEVALSKSEENVTHHVKLANRAADVLKTALYQKCIRLSEFNPEKLTLHVQITQCSDGGRIGRPCCGGVRIGWAILFLEWSLSDDETEEIVIGPEIEHFRDSGTIGIADICDHNLGDNFVLGMAKYSGPDAINEKIDKAFQTE